MHADIKKQFRVARSGVIQRHDHCPSFALEKVVMGRLPATDALPFFVTLEEKAFEKVGIEVDSQKFTSPTTRVGTFITNQAEVGPYGTAPGFAFVAESRNPWSLKLFGLASAIADTESVNSTPAGEKGSTSAERPRHALQGESHAGSRQY
jgi:ABC-type nitrate/sulfonate/bicarbonate transport system substrate-binding protein